MSIHPRRPGAQAVTDIVERLEAEAGLPGADKWLLQEAADIIERLTAEIRDGKSQSKEALRELRAEIERLTGTNLHLRQAIAYMDDHADSPTIIRREVRRALEPKP